MNIVKKSSSPYIVMDIAIHYFKLKFYVAVIYVSENRESANLPRKRLQST